MKYRTTIDRDSWVMPNSSKQLTGFLGLGNATPKIIEEDSKDLNSYDSLMPRLEEHKSSQESSSPNDSDDFFFDVELDDFQASNTPRFDEDQNELTIIKWVSGDVSVYWS